MSVKPYSDSRWRNYAAPIIQNVLREHADADEKTIRKALHDAYPFGQRKYHPYKIWCDEIKRQRCGGPVPRFLSKEDLQRKPVFGNKGDPFGDDARSSPS